ncbi:anti-sigma factor [Streptosporangium subroseum]|uniref:anti-sigma factor n=1 Tax=Streptosporangium subroseum TaxID=106412 RepID=UPI00341CD845
MNATTGGHDPHTLAGAYALDAIDDELERRRFEEHLDRCAECAQEIRGLTETAARMGQAAAVEPPAWLKDRVMAEIGQVRQLPPALTRTSASRRGRTGRSRWWPRVTAVVAAVATAAAVTVGVLAIQARNQLEQVRQANHDLTAVIAAPDARTITAPAAQGGAGTGTVIVSRSQDRLVFLAAGLAPLPQDRTYQLWQIAPGQIRSAGLLRPDTGGYTAPVVTAPDPGATQMGLTVEPAGGSTQPSTQPLLLVSMSAT